jgi:hypothetical protein
VLALLNPPPVPLPFLVQDGQVNNNLMDSTHVMQSLLIHILPFQSFSAKHASQVGQCLLKENEQWFDA